MKCSLWEDCGWVCENHPDKPWEGEHACPCGGAGMPRRNCNMSDDDKIMQCRRVATRYDKLAANYLAFIKLASIRIWLRSYLAIRNVGKGQPALSA
jgi:transposase